MSKRLHLLDALRGFTLIHMIAFHGLWNLVYLFGFRLPWYTGTPGYVWQQAICWTFILLSGFCWNLGRNPLKRGLIVFDCGILVTVVTAVFMPDALIFCGVLTCIGGCMLILTYGKDFFSKIPSVAGLAGSLVLFFLMRNVPNGTLGFERLVICPLPEWLYRNLFTACLGFPPAGFFSTDYFPLIPWLFLFLAGYFLFRILEERGLNEKLFAKGELPVLNWMGRHSLLIYLLHQPVLYGLCLLFF